MNTLELREAVAIRLKEIREKCIWERALRIVEAFGKKNQG